MAPGRAQRRGNVGMVDGLWSEQIDPKYTKGHDPHVTHQTETKTNQQESDHQTTTTIGWPDRTEEKSSVERPRNATQKRSSDI